MSKVSSKSQIEFALGPPRSSCSKLIYQNSFLLGNSTFISITLLESSRNTAGNSKTVSSMFNNTTNPLTKRELVAVHEQLGNVQDFENPKLLLEQYMTDRSTAGKFIIIFYENIQMNIILVEFMQLVDRCVGIREKRVLDLGCGTGMLGIASLLCEAE